MINQRENLTAAGDNTTGIAWVLVQLLEGAGGRSNCHKSKLPLEPTAVQALTGQAWQHKPDERGPSLNH